MPKFKTEAAAELLGKLLELAVAQSPGLHRRHFQIELGVIGAVSEAALCEVLATPFLMQTEGWEVPIPTLERGAIDGNVLRYTVHETYAAHLLFTSPEQPLLLNCAAAARHAIRGVELTEREFAIVIDSLRGHYREQGVAYTLHTIYALRNRRHHCGPEEFGMADTAAVLRKLGADTAP